MDLNNSKTPVLSIGLPVFNGEEYIQQAVRSILQQSFVDWELIIIDDGSTDNTLDLIREFGDDRIVIFSDKINKGLAARLNEAIFLAQGKYFARMDQDDICHPDRFFHQIKYLENHNEVDLVGCQCITINENNTVVGTIPIATTHNEICRRPWSGFYLPHPSWVGKLAWFKKHLYANPAPLLCEDQELLLRTYLSSNFYNVPHFLLAYRIRSRLNLRRSIKIRLSVSAMQIKHFQYYKDYKSLALILFVTSGRVIKDFGVWLNQVLNISKKKNNLPLLNNSDGSSWDSYVAQLKR